MRPATGLICQFIDQHKQEHGAVPVCRALSAHGIQIAPRTYWAYLRHVPSRRELWDTAVGADNSSVLVRDAGIEIVLSGVPMPE